jgi:hypothetical protein
MPRQTAEQRIAALEAQIQAIKAKAAAEKVKKDPALKFVSKAIRFIDNASGETKDAALREAFAEARSTLSACLQIKGVTAGIKASGPRRGSNGHASIPVDRDTLLKYVKGNPGSRGEQIASALGTHVNIMRPVMKALIADRKVRTAGERRGMTYSPA